MAKLTPRRTKSQETRKKLFDAAVKLMKEHGEDYLTVANICEVAGVSKGTFFYHFNSKDELMLYYLQEGFDTFVEQRGGNTVDDANGDVCKIIATLYHEYLDYCQETGIEFVSNYYQSKNKALDARNTMGTRDTMNYLLRTCADSLTKAQREGYIRQDWSASDISYDCCSVIKGCVFEWCLSEGSIDLNAHADHMLYAYFTNIVTDKHRKAFSFEEPPMA